MTMKIRITVQVLVILTISTTALTDNYYGRTRYPSENFKIGQHRRYSAQIRENLTTNDPVAINFQTEDNNDNNVITRQLRIKHTPPCDDLGGGQGFCTEDQEYNSTISNLFSRILKNIPSIHVLSDVLNETIIEDESENNPHLRNRVGFSSEQTLCASVETIIYPKRGQTANKDWVFILNQGPVQQGVKVEKCLKPNGPCVLGGGPIEQTACRQKYVYKKLLAMDTSGNNIVSESIYMPSCCVCYVSNDFVSTRSSFQTRFIQANDTTD